MLHMRKGCLNEQLQLAPGKRVAVKYRSSRRVSSEAHRSMVGRFQLIDQRLGFSQDRGRNSQSSQLWSLLPFGRSSGSCTELSHWCRSVQTWRWLPWCWVGGSSQPLCKSVSSRTQGWILRIREQVAPCWPSPTCCRRLDLDSLPSPACRSLSGSKWSTYFLSFRSVFSYLEYSRCMTPRPLEVWNRISRIALVWTRMSPNVPSSLF